MPKIASPVPSVIPLLALHNLFREYVQIPSPERMTDTAYTESLTKALIDKGVIVKGNENFVASFRSKPLESKVAKAGGIDTQKLDQVALLVIDHFRLRELFHLPKDIQYPWDVFSTLIFPTPPYLKQVDEKRYYKFLSDEEKNAVDSYLVRKYNEIGVIKSSIINYAVYLWNIEHKEVRCAILSIDPVKKSAIYTYYAPTPDGWVSKGILKSNNFIHGGAILFIDCQEEDPAKPFIRANFLLSVVDAQLDNVKLIGGIFAISGRNATSPVSCRCVIERCNSYFEAYGKVVDDSKKTSALCLEVQGDRFEITDTNSFSLNQLKSSPLYRLLEELRGYYHIAYLTQDRSVDGPGKLSNGLCYIGLDGIVLIQMTNSKKTLKAYIDQQIYRGNKFLCINYFLSQPDDEYDMQYRLEVERDYKNGGAVQYLYGCFAGFIIGTIYKGDLSLWRLPDNDFKKDGKYVDFAEALKINPLSKSKDIDKEKLTDIELKQLEILKQKRYDH